MKNKESLVLRWAQDTHQNPSFHTGVPMPSVCDQCQLRFPQTPRMDPAITRERWMINLAKPIIVQLGKLRPRLGPVCQQQGAPGQRSLCSIVPPPFAPCRQAVCTRGIRNSFIHLSQSAADEKHMRTCKPKPHRMCSHFPRHSGPSRKEQASSWATWGPGQVQGRRVRGLGCTAGAELCGPGPLLGWGWPGIEGEG